MKGTIRNRPTCLFTIDSRYPRYIKNQPQPLIVGPEWNVLRCNVKCHGLELHLLRRIQYEFMYSARNHEMSIRFSLKQGSYNFFGSAQITMGKNFAPKITTNFGVFTVFSFRVVILQKKMYWFFKKCSDFGHEIFWP